jgi:hypothetical protein
MIFFLQKYGKYWFSTSSFFFLNMYARTILFFRRYLYFPFYIRECISEPKEGLSWKYEGVLMKTNKIYKMIHYYREYRPVIRNRTWIPTFLYDTEKIREEVREKIREEEIQEKIYMISLGRQCFCKINIPNTFTDSLSILTVSNLRSEVSFFLIEFISSSKWYSPITLSISKEVLMVGNELFSPAFLLRLLEHQMEPFYFDDKYQLVLVDHHLVSFILKPNQFIRLQEKTYDIITF